MWLSNVDLERYIDAKLIQVDPKPTLSIIQPASLDVHLGSNGKMFKSKPEPWDRTIIDPGEDNSNLLGNVIIPRRDQPAIFTLEPGQVMLAHIAEHIQVPRWLVALLHGCSGLARIFLFVHINAGLLDPFWGGRATAELFNASPFPIRLWEGMRIGTVTFHRLQTPALPGYGEGRYNSSYQGDMITEGSRYHRNYTEVLVGPNGTAK